MKKKTSAIDAFMALPDEEKERQWREFDKEFIFETARPLTKAQRALWERAKRRPGRPREGAGAKTAVWSSRFSVRRRQFPARAR